jgi:FkbM family methyltransferase
MYNGDLDKGYHLDQYIEKLLKDEFGVDRDGTFVDIGAYHPTILSNSHYFEKVKNFKVLCVEANPVMADLLRQHRDHVFECAASDKSGETVAFQVVTGPWDPHGYAGSGMHTYEGVRGQTTPKNASKIENISVTTRTLNDILEESGVSQIDAMSIDVEGHELNVLNGLDFDKYKPKVCCIENYFSDIWLDEYMNLKGYKKVNRLHVDDFFIRIKQGEQV